MEGGLRRWVGGGRRWEVGRGVGGGGVEMSPDCFQMISFVDSLSVVCGGVWEEEWEEVGGRRWDVVGRR